MSLQLYSHIDNLNADFNIHIFEEVKLFSFQYLENLKIPFDNKSITYRNLITKFNCILKDMKCAELSKLLSNLKKYDYTTYTHSIKVAFLSFYLGHILFFDYEELFSLYLGAIFHDIGKTFIDTSILTKQSKLTEIEFSIIKRHPFLGYALLSSSPFFSQDSLDIILCHHEKLNGSGYPFGCDSTSLSTSIQIVSICDVFDAIVSKRPYKDKCTISSAISYLNENPSLFNLTLVNLLNLAIKKD